MGKDVNSAAQLDEMGHFWLARDEDGEHAVSGRIIIDEQGVATLKVFSPLVPQADSLLAHQLERVANIRVLGITETNKKITIERASASGVGFAFGTGTGVDTRTFLSDKVVIGALYDFQEEIRFHEIWYQIDYTFEWFGQSGLTEKGRSAFGEPVKVTVEYRQPRPIEIDLVEGTTCKIHFGWSIPAAQPWSVSWDMKQTCSLALRQAKDEWTLSDVESIAFCLQSFFAVMTGENIGITAQDAYSQAKRDTTGGDLLKIQIPHRDFLRGEDLEASAMPELMLVTYADVSDHFAKFFGNWQNLCQRDESAIRQAMISRYGKHTWPEHLLLLSRAVEVFVGKRVGKEAEFVDVVRHLARMCESEVDGHLDIEQFADAVRRYRNWFTHFDRKRASIEVDYGEVRVLVRNLRGMLDLYMLRQCLPDALDYRDLLYEGKELKWGLRRYLKLHPKHVVAT